MQPSEDRARDLLFGLIALQVGLIDQSRLVAGFQAWSLDHWEKDPDLAGVREPEALAKLPEAERESRRALRADVAALRTRTRGRR